MKKLRKRIIKRRQLKFRSSCANNKCACVAQVCAGAHMPTCTYARVWKNAAPEKRRTRKKTNTASSDSRINFAILIFRPIRRTKSVRRSFPFDFSGEIFYKNQKFSNYFWKSTVFFLRFFRKYDRIILYFWFVFPIKTRNDFSKNSGTALTARRRTDSQKKQGYLNSLCSQS